GPEMRDRRIPVAVLADGELELVQGRGGGGGGKQRRRGQCDGQSVDTGHHGSPLVPERSKSSRLSNPIRLRRYGKPVTPPQGVKRRRAAGYAVADALGIRKPGAEAWHRRNRRCVQRPALGPDREGANDRCCYLSLRSKSLATRQKFHTYQMAMQTLARSPW